LGLKHAEGGVRTTRGPPTCRLGRENEHNPLTRAKVPGEVFTR
jgi:hypothetical protein